jgi:SNF2 family DNA or RNA helicase
MSGFREKFISSTSSSASGPRRSPAKFVVAKAEEIFTPPSQRSQFDLIVDDEVSSRRRSPESRSQVEGSPMKFRALGKKTEFEFATPESASELVLDEPGVEDDGSLRTRVAIPAALACKLRFFFFFLFFFFFFSFFCLVRSYQVDGVRFLYQRWKEDLGSILGDDMGLGKTIQVVSLLVALCANRVGKFLIITPLTCSDQWTHELTRWGGLRSSLFHGGTTAKRAAMADVQSGRVDILVTSYEVGIRERFKKAVVLIVAFWPDVFARGRCFGALSGWFQTVPLSISFFKSIGSGLALCLMSSTS